MKDGLPQLIAFVVFWMGIILIAVFTINAVNDVYQNRFTLPMTSPYSEAVVELVGIPEEFKDTVLEVSDDTGVPVHIIHSIAQRESGYVETALNTANANGSQDRGLMQLNSNYLEYYVDRYWDGEVFDVWDGDHSIRMAGLYLKDLYNATGCWENAVKAYNVGLSSVQKGRAKNASEAYYEHLVDNYIEFKRSNYD